MLKLARMTYFNEFKRDTVDDRVIGPGEYYYYDDDDGLVISAEHYWELKQQKMTDEFDNSYYNYMEAQKDYKERMRQAEQKYNQQTVLDRVKLNDLR